MSITRAALIVFLTLLAVAPMARPAHALIENNKACTITYVEIDVQNNGNRLIIRCDSPAPGAGGASIVYFAVNMTKQLERAKMVLSMATAAKIAGRQLTIYYFSDDASTTSFDMACNPKDCRPITRIGLN